MASTSVSPHRARLAAGGVGPSYRRLRPLPDWLPYIPESTSARRRPRASWPTRTATSSSSAWSPSTKPSATTPTPSSKPRSPSPATSPLARPPGRRPGRRRRGAGGRALHPDGVSDTRGSRVRRDSRGRPRRPAPGRSA
ncbi:hypothetical protein LT493_17990 [Streptomyces tricolor]|nr:hypothetical protein [Streptomyces tricolor]